MGFSKLTKGDYENLSTTIGGLTHGATVEENANAYSTFANGGQFIDAYMIEKIEDLDGNVIYEHQVQPVEVFSTETAYMVTDMLRDVLSEGTATRAKSMLKFSSDFAAKTGTTQEHKDVWLVGYNPTITLGVWLGYDQPKTLYAFNNTYHQPSTRVNMLWATLMNKMYDTKPELVGTSEKFEQPENVVSASFCGISGLAPSEACSNAGLVRTDLFNKNVFLPTQPDDSFVSSTSVIVDDRSYVALPSTPTEFVEMGGYGFNQTFIDRMLGRLGGDASKLLPYRQGRSVVSGATFDADSTAPAAVTANLDGTLLSWSKSDSNDVIGYRVYSISPQGRVLISTLKSNGGRKIGVDLNTSYIVVAVDITGLESAHSNEVGHTFVEPEPVEEKVPVDDYDFDFDLDFDFNNGESDESESE